MVWLFQLGVQLSNSPSELSYESIAYIDLVTQLIVNIVDLLLLRIDQAHHLVFLSDQLIVPDLNSLDRSRRVLGDFPLESLVLHLEGSVVHDLIVQFLF